MGRTHLGAAAAIVAVATLAPPALARPVADVTYGGKTSAKWPAMVQLSRDTATVHYAASITGKVNKRRSRITGTVRVTQRYTDPGAGVDTTCDTGTVAYVGIN